jgi:hypothetical protein
MTLLSNLNQFIALFLDTLRQLARGRIWLVLLAYALVNAFVLYAHNDFLSPYFYGVISWWLGVLTAIIPESMLPAAAAEIFTHYPGHYLTMPALFGWAKTFVALLFEGVVLGAVAILFWNAYLKATGAEAIPASRSIKRWLHLVAVWIVLNGLFMLVNRWAPDLASSMIAHHPRRALLFEFTVMPVLQSLVLGLLFFVFPAVALFGDNAWKAVTRSLRIFIRRPFSAFFLAAVILTGPIVVASISSRAGDIVTKFRPELVYWVLLASIVVEMVANFLWMGTAVRFLVDSDEE